jgi:hypothetical protein
MDWLKFDTTGPPIGELSALLSLCTVPATGFLLNYFYD